MKVNQPLLEIKNLKVYYEMPAGPVKAVDDVSLTVNKDEVVGVAGESGCGKTTLGMSILRLIRPPGYIKEGEILFDGEDLTTLKSESLRRIRWKRISLISQSAMNALNPVMKVRSQMADAIMAHEKISSKALEESISTLLKRVNLDPGVAGMFPHELSGGMKQRCIISMAMALKPDLIIADEPTTALDVVVQRGVLETLMDLKKETRSSIILLSHDIAIQAEIADRLAVMYAGKVIEVGEIQSIFREPLHPYTQGLISAVPSIKKRRMLKGLPGLPPNLINPPPGCRFHPRCPHVMEICKQKEPILLEVKPERHVACHLYKQGGKS